MTQVALTTASDGNSLFHSFPLNVPPEFHRYSVKQGPLANSIIHNKNNNWVQLYFIIIIFFLPLIRCTIYSWFVDISK